MLAMACDKAVFSDTSRLRRSFLAGAFSVFGLSACRRKAPEAIFRVRLTFHFSHPAGSKSF